MYSRPDHDFLILERLGVVVQMCVSCANIPSELNLVNQKSDNDIMPLFQLGKTDGLAGLTLNPCPEEKATHLYQLIAHTAAGVTQ